MPAAAPELEASGRDKWQAFYADRARSVPFFSGAPDENLHDWLRQGLIAPGAALDIGCGNGRNAIFLARQPGFGPVQAVDYSASAAAWAREAIAHAGVSVQLHEGSIFELALPPASLDLIYDSGCFHHMAPHQRDDYVRLVAQALKPGAAFGLVCFAPEGGSGLSDDEVYARGTLGGGLGYSEPRLRELWHEGTLFDIVVLRRMREPGAEAGLFGKGLLWAMLARRRSQREEARLSATS
jgi:SAM-dependent methyltransferase